MQLAEMRSALDAGNAKRGFPALPDSAPDWALRNIYERRNGLELTPLPNGIEVRSASGIMAGSRIALAKAIVQEHEARKKSNVTDEADRDMARLRVAVARLS